MKTIVFSRTARRWMFRLALPLPFLAAIYLSTHGVADVLGAVVTFPSVSFIGYDWEHPVNALSGRRQVQRHFMDYGVHIPLENIVATGDDSATSARLVDLSIEACGSGDLIIWIPLRLKLPLMGDWVTEWCWVPKIKRLR